MRISSLRIRTMRFSTVLLAASGWVALAATTLPPASTVRIAASLAFVLVCPGAAVLRVVSATARGPVVTTEPGYRAALAVAASLAVATLASEAFFLAGAFTAVRCAATLACLTSLLAFVPETDGVRRRPVFET